MSFYPDTGSLQNFFNITGITTPAQYPPINEEEVTGHLGDFKFSDAYLKTFNFSVSANRIVSATANFEVYGKLEKDSNISTTYYSKELYDQKSIPHGETSNIIGTTSLGVDHATSFSYSMSVDRVPRITIGNSTPIRVSKQSTTIEMSVNGNNLNPDIFTDSTRDKRANLSIFLKMLETYQYL